MVYMYLQIFIIDMIEFGFCHGMFWSLPVIILKRFKHESAENEGGTSIRGKMLWMTFLIESLQILNEKKSNMSQIKIHTEKNLNYEYCIVRDLIC